MPIADKMIRKYKEKTPAAAPEWLKACKEVTVDPIKLALAANDKRIARLQESIANKTWETKMGKRSKADWDRGIDAAGESGFRSGVEAHVSKFEKFVNAFAPNYEAAKRQAEAIPVKTIDDALKRVEKVVKFLHSKKGTW
jgi:hypothetical protein